MSIYKVKDRVSTGNGEENLLSLHAVGLLISHAEIANLYRDASCHACGKKGHIVPVCKSVPQKKPSWAQGLPGRSRRTYRKTKAIKKLERWKVVVVAAVAMNTPSC